MSLQLKVPKDICVISPHLDDACFFCGGAINRWRQEGKRVTIFTIFTKAGNKLPDPFAYYLHARWGELDPVKLNHMRKFEDVMALPILGVDPNRILWAGKLEMLYMGDELVEDPIEFYKMFSFMPFQRVYIPGNFCGHIEHRVIRSAVEMGLRSQYKYPEEMIRYYHDYPLYPDYLEFVDKGEGLIEQPVKLSIKNLLIKYRACKQYKTQVRDLFGNSNFKLFRWLLSHPEKFYKLSQPIERERI